MKQLHFLRPAALLLTIAAAPVLNGQDFLNGSFEKNGNICMINASVPVFNANVKNTHAFGSFRKPDIASNNCGHGDAKDGNWFIGLATNIEGAVRSEAVTLELNSPLVKGNQYNLVFWTRSRVNASNIELGLSANDSTAGNIFYTVSSGTITSEWKEVSVRFTAPENGKYISVRAVNPHGNSGIWLDAFRLSTVFSPDLVVLPGPVKQGSASVKMNSNAAAKKQSYDVDVYPNPSSGVFKVNADTAQVLSLVVYNTLGMPIEEHKATDEEPIPQSIDLTSQQPGLYFLELATVEGKVTKRIIVSR